MYSALLFVSSEDAWIEPRPNRPAVWVTSAYAGLRRHGNSEYLGIKGSLCLHERRVRRCGNLAPNVWNRLRTCPAVLQATIVILRPNTSRRKIVSRTS